MTKPFSTPDRYVSDFRHNRLRGGPSWASIHHGGGVGIGRSIHAGQVSVADGAGLARQNLERVLTNDRGMGVIRHVDAGYEQAGQVAAERGVRVPMREG